MRKLWIILLLLSLALPACGGNANEANSTVLEPEGQVVSDIVPDDEPDDEIIDVSGTTGTETAAGDAFVGNCEVSGPLRLWNWSSYMDPELMAEFGARYGIEVTEDNYSSNEDMLSKLQAGNSGYDLVFPSDYAVGLAAQAGLLAELERANIPNIENLNPELMGLYYDPENQYSVPFQWGVTGIAYNTTYFESPPDSWGYLFDAELAGSVDGFFSMLDDEREAIGAGLKFLGYSVNDTDPEHVAQAEELLLTQKQMPNFSAYNSDNFNQTLASEEVIIAQAWSGGAALAASENEAIRFVVPQEGGVIWQDNMAIPADAPNKCTAELFINFMLEPEIAARLSDYTYYNSPVPAALELLDPFTQELLAKGFTPDEATMGRVEWIERSDDTIFSDTWTEIKSR